MNKLLVIGIIVILLVGGAVWYFTSDSGTNDGQSTAEPSSGNSEYASIETAEDDFSNIDESLDLLG